MKRIIIAAAILLTSAVTAMSLSRKEVKPVNENKIKTEVADFSSKPQTAHRSDLSSAD